ncbi:hypothetical protein IJ541_04170 [bacterium]|nr:hypothetical protein [bacterium]
MKKFLKIFFIFISFFISLGVNACDVKSSYVDYVKPLKQEIFVQNFQDNQAIVSSNSQNLVIYSSNDKKEIYIRSLDKNAPKSRLLNHIFTKNYNKVFISNSHKISSYLKNEICARAP